MLREHMRGFSAAELAGRFEQAGLPYAPITRPQDLFDDPHLRATGGLAPMTVPADASGAERPRDTHAALLPLTLDGQRLPLRRPPPSIGGDSAQLLGELGYSPTDIAALREAGVVGVPQAGPAATELHPAL
jgi:crotonobetainyl-CoA:carnitine CoA-transferase CaiB-like acyl-CoA transferase